MAIFLKFDKKQTNSSGFIPLKRGDDWKLLGKVIDKYPRVEDDFDLTGVSATAFFSGDPSGTVTSVVQVTKPDCGGVEIDVPASATPGVALAENGTTIYLVADHPTKGTITIDTELPVLEIKDRGFAES